MFLYSIFFSRLCKVSHHVMGMGFSLVVQPDSLNELPSSVLSCSDHGLASGKLGNGKNSTTSSGQSSSILFYHFSILTTIIVTVAGTAYSWLI
jgi:hypothetical protein